MGEQELVRQARQGDQRAFSQLAGRHSSMVYSLCYRMVGDPAEAEDLAQEALLRFYRSLHRLRPEAPVAPWLHRITANVCMDRLRLRRRATVSLDTAGDAVLEIQSYSRQEQPEHAYLDLERDGEIRAALLRLPVDYRMALVLRFMEDLSYQEIAQALEVPVSTVETRLFRARRALAQLLRAGRLEAEKGGAR